MYNAIIARITVRPHPNADRIKLGTVLGHQVIVGTATQTGEIGVFFPPDGQLSEEYAKANKLTKEDGGYLDEKRRVKALRLRGEKSEGLFMPVSSLGYTGSVVVTEGEQFTEFNGRPICNKYETPKTQKAQKHKQGTAKPQNPYFKKHYDTPQWRFFKHLVPDNAHVVITEKLHGTSGRYGLVLCTPKARWWQSLLGITPRPTYEYLVGTRNIVLDSAKLAAGTSFYGKEDFRFHAVRDIQLYQGETLYFELVGYTGVDSLIMPAHPIKDKELKKQYGETMRYTYGQPDGTCGLYVYRITRTSHEGVVTELSWNQVKQRCVELGIQHVPEVFYHLTYHKSDDSDVETGVNLSTIVDRLTDGSSSLDARHIREGVVVRVESEHGVHCYKNKSFDFGVLEGYIKDDENYVDTEEAS